MARSIFAKLAGVALALAVAPDRTAPIAVVEPAPIQLSSVSMWHGFRRHHLSVSGRLAFVVDPETVADGAPWIWRATFWGFSPDVDVALLTQGFHLGYVETEDMYGSPRALAIWDEFYRLARERGLSAKPVLEGISRGGLYAYRWAEAHPEQVSAILGDAPVCDFRSWPKGQSGTGSPADWLALEKEYGFGSDEEALRFPDNPVDRLEPLARAGVLLVHVYGEADRVVPPDENTLLVAARYRALGGRIELFPKPGVGHVHGLRDVTPLVTLLRDAALRRDAAP
jgi:hypothetical protein